MTRTATTAGSKTVTVKKLKAKHFANQAGLDRLQELLVKATSNPNAGQNYAMTIKRAFKSLQECKEPILTQKDALKLKFIGPAMARRICPQSTGVEVATDTSSKPNKSKATAKNKPATKSGTNRNENEDNNDQARKLVAAADSLHRKPPATGLPLVCPRPAIPSASGCTSALEASLEPMAATAKELAYAMAKGEAERLVLPPKGPWKVILLVDIREHKSKQVVSSCKQAGIPCEERQLAIGDMAWIARCVVPNQTEALGLADTSKKRKKKKDVDKFRTIEILVGTIVERKEVSDLAASLYGTRYAEQRLRLSQSGLPQVLFLVEGNLASLDNCPAETLQMAMMETRINLGFQIIQTKHLTDTVSILKTLHSRIVQRTFPDAFGKPSANHHSGGASQQALPTFGGGNRRRGGRGNRRASSLLELVFDTAPVPPFGTKRFITYPELKAKVEVDRERGTRSVRAISLAMLKQIPTLSQKKCTAIANRYPTLNRLLSALAYPSHTAGVLDRKQHPKNIVQEIAIESGRRTIGPKSASEVYAACCTLQDGSTVACHEQDTSQSSSMSQRRISSFLSRTGSSDNVIEENRKPPPISATNTAQPAATTTTTRPEKSPPKKARREYASAITTTTTQTNTCLQILDSSDDSSPEKSPRAFTTRKRPAAVSSIAGKMSSLETYHNGGYKTQSGFVDNRNPPHGNTVDSPNQRQQETVDLLTPEPSPKAKAKSKPKPKPTVAKENGRMDLSDWSDSSNEVRRIGRKGKNKNNTIASNARAKTSTTKNTASTSNIATTSSTTATRCPITKQRSGPNLREEVTLLLSSDEDESPLRDNTNTNDAAKKPTTTSDTLCLATERRGLGSSFVDDTLLSSPDKDDSPFPTSNSTSEPASKSRLDSSCQETPKHSRLKTKGVRGRLSLASSSGGESFLFSSPDDTLFTPSPPKRTNQSKLQTATDKKPSPQPAPPRQAQQESGIGVVCLLDDSDDEIRDEAGESVACKGRNESSDAFAALPTLGRNNAFVNTTRGGALPSTQESACNDDDGSSSVEDLEFGTSLRERLGKIRGQDLREVIELDSDSE